MHCIFCQIAAHEAPAYIVYEDEFVMAFLDRDPISKGHTLIIPKQDVKDIHELNSETATRIMILAKNLAGVIEQEFQFDGSMIMEVNGAFQEVPHFHLHVFGRHKNNDIEFAYPKNIQGASDFAEIKARFAQSGFSRADRDAD